jgi:hypothetical protein
MLASPARTLPLHRRDPRFTQLLVPLLCGWTALGGAGTTPALDQRAGQAQGAPAAPETAERAAGQALVQSFRAQGIELSLAERWLAFGVQVQVREDFLEYFLVGPAGAGHESLFVTDVKPSLLATALVTLGAEPGTNAQWTPKQPPPSDQELRAGALPFDVALPRGTPFYLYAAWKQGDEVYFHRAEDLVRDLSKGRSMQRHALVYLGSKFVPASRGNPDGADEVLAADVYQNLISVCFFTAGDALFTTALAECVYQDIWTANAWLLPERGESVTLLLARERLELLPGALREKLSTVAAPKAVRSQ